MLSILIPVYNFHPAILVGGLLAQMQELKLEGEIVLLDDGSQPDIRIQNQQLTELGPEVRYEELPKNVGRSRIRNLLAERARYANLLFLDCDAVLQDSEFLLNYLPYLDSGKVVCGGRVVPFSPLIHETQHLRWLYSLWRECRPASLRNQEPYQGFLTNNFLVPAELFQNIRFDETLVGYGHEDTAFGYGLSRLQWPLVHIDNPVSYSEYDEAPRFLEKTLEAMDNLNRLLARLPEAEREGFRNTVPLLRLSRRLGRLGLAAPLRALLDKPWIIQLLEKNLTGPNPLLQFFDLWKLLHWLRRSAAQPT